MNAHKAAVKTAKAHRANIRDEKVLDEGCYKGCSSSR